MTLIPSRVRVPVLGFALLLALPACGDASGGSGGGGGAPLEKLSGCKLDFEANVTEGPNAGLTIKGPMELQGADEGAFGKITADGVEVPVTAIFAGDDITLRFWLKDGTIIEGTGPMESTLAECSGKMEGTLEGPLAGDKGDWLGLPQGQYACSSRCYFHPPLPSGCKINCTVVVGTTLGTPAYESCYDACISGPSFYYCDNVAMFFDPCTYAY